MRLSDAVMCQTDEAWGDIKRKTTVEGNVHFAEIWCAWKFGQMKATEQRLNKPCNVCVK